MCTAPRIPAARSAHSSKEADRRLMQRSALRAARSVTPSASRPTVARESRGHPSVGRPPVLTVRMSPGLSDPAGRAQRPQDRPQPAPLCECGLCVAPVSRLAPGPAAVHPAATVLHRRGSAGLSQCAVSRSPASRGASPIQDDAARRLRTGPHVGLPPTKKRVCTDSNSWPQALL